MRKILILVLIIIGCSFFENYAQNRLYTLNGTSRDIADTVAFPFISRMVTVINDAASTDTLFISLVPNFPSSMTIKRIGGEGFSIPWVVQTIYLKFGVYADTGKKYRLEIY